MACVGVYRGVTLTEMVEMGRDPDVINAIDTPIDDDGRGAV